MHTSVDIPWNLPYIWIVWFPQHGFDLMILVAEPDDSKWPFYPLVEGHDSLFERVT